MSSEISDKEQKPPQEEIDFNNQDQPKEKIEGQEEDQKEENPNEPQEENKKIFVKNIPFNTTDEQLQTFFQAHGNVVSAQIFKNSDNGHSKGVGLVEFMTTEEKNAVLKMNPEDLVLDGRKLEVREAHDKERTDYSKTIFVGNITFETTEEKLRQFFEDVAKNFEVKIQNNDNSGRSKGYAYVIFENAEDVENALKKNGQELDGRTLTIEKKRVGRGSSFRRGRVGGRYGVRRDERRPGFGGYHRYDRRDYHYHSRSRSYDRRYHDRDREHREHRYRDNRDRSRDHERRERSSRDHERRERSSRDRDRDHDRDHRHSRHDRDKI